VRMAPVRSRLVIVLGAVAVGACFVAGLFVHGPGGGALLALTDVILIALTGAAWSHVQRRARPFRVVVIVAIAALAVVKLTGNA
jgi:hypothetical protein